MKHATKSIGRPAIRPAVQNKTNAIRRDGATLSGWGVIAIMLASTATIMVGSAITPAIPAIGAHFGLGDAASWLVTMPAIGVVASALFFGRLIAKPGPYKVCAIFLPLYGLLGLTGSFAPNAPLLLATASCWVCAPPP